MYKEITQEQASKIIEARQPLGLFYHQYEKGYVGIDNSDGEAWTEDFSTREECMQWLRNCD